MLLLRFHRNNKLANFCEDLEDVGDCWFSSQDEAWVGLNRGALCCLQSGRMFSVLSPEDKKKKNMEQREINEEHR